MLINLRIITNVILSLVFACASSALAEEKAPGKELSPCAFLDESLRIFKAIVDGVEKTYRHLCGRVYDDTLHATEYFAFCSNFIKELPAKKHRTPP